MRLHRGIWAGACLLLALVGCGGDKKTIKGVGVYSPIITGISSNHEPVARGAANQLTAQVTNVNNLPLQYQWQVQAGTLDQTTGATVTWTPPDSIATYDVTVTVQADDGGTHFSKTMTVHMSVDNEFTRWTNTEAIKFDPAPTSGGGVLYAEYHNPTIRSSDVYRVDAPLGGPVQLTSGFFSVTAPSPRADQVDFAFTGRKNQTDSVAIYILPFGGGDASVARQFEHRSPSQTFLALPRFGWAGTQLAYVSDSTNGGSGGHTLLYYHDGATLTPPKAVADDNASFPTFLSNPSWGRDQNSDGVPDSMLATAIDFPGTFAEQSRGIWVFAIGPDHGTPWQEWLSGAPILTPDWSPDGQYVVFAMRNLGTNDRDIWIINRAATDISQAVRVTSGPADESQPRFSSDGNTIFFVSNRVDRYGVTGIFGTQRRGTNIWSVAQFDRP